MNDSNLTNSENEASRGEAALLPLVDVVEDADGITLYADLPGVSKDKVSVRVEADTLAIEGQVDLLAHQSVEVTHAEVQLPRYRRTFTLGPELNTAKVAAEFRQGVLKLRIPKAEHAKPRRIDVQVA
jgi:HSP20 family protein